MLILGVETSCDETSAAVVADGRHILSNVVLSQIDQHAVFGGVVPEIASRQHVRAIAGVVDEALRVASLSAASLDLVASTQGPGLAGSLLVGVNFALGFALGTGIPHVPVNHIDGHIHSVWLTRSDPVPAPPQFPLLVLVVSGGHTELILMRGHGEYRLVGRTRDDAAGEAFDKVARLLGLPYPGGPSIERAAHHAGAPVQFPRAWLGDSFDFSFSGLKTATLREAILRTGAGTANSGSRKSLYSAEVAAKLRPEEVANLAAGFQDSVVDVLVSKTVRAARSHGAASVAVVGGVAANTALRDAMTERVDLPLFVAEREFSTDNAAMIAAAAFYGPRVEPAEVDVLPGLRLDTYSAEG